MSAWAALALATAGAMAQSLTWVARETRAGAYTDLGREVATYDDGETAWVYTVGTVSLSSTVSVIAVHRYRVVDDNPPDPAGEILFPAPGTSPTGLSGGVGIAIDRTLSHGGDVYVVGHSRIKPDGSYGSDMNYVILRIEHVDENEIALSDGWEHIGSLPDGVRLYNPGPGDGDDIPADVLVDNASFVYVTGKSWADDSGYDIATLKYAQDGELSETWPELEEPPHPDIGIRRYTFEEANEYEDVPAELAVGYFDEGDAAYTALYVAATSYTGVTEKKDFTTICYGIDGSEAEDPEHYGFVSRYTGPGQGDDVATGIAFGPDGGPNVSVVWIGGWSTMPAQSMSPTAHTDFTVIAYDGDSGEPVWDDDPAQSGDFARHWDRPTEGEEYAYDIAYLPSNSHPGNDVTLWLTGKSRADNDFDIATVQFEGSTGDLRGYHLYQRNSQSDPPSNDYGNAIVAGAGALYVAGQADDGDGDFDIVLLKYAFGEDPYPIELQWSQVHDEGEGHDAALAIARFVDFVIATGSSAGDGSGLDLLTVNYEDVP